MDECNIDSPEKEQKRVGEIHMPVSVEQGLQMLNESIDLDQLAKETGALVRCRGVHSAMALLRILLGYGALDFSLRMLGAWATVLQLGSISKTAHLRRLQKCQRFLGKLVVLALARQKLYLPQGLRIRMKLLDATVVCQPGSKGVDWRLHFSFDLAAGCMDQVTVTTGKEAELAERFTCREGEIWIGDRAYAIARSLAHFVFSGAWLVIRTGWNRLAWENEAGNPFDLIGWLKSLQLQPEDLGQETRVWVTSPQGRFSLRLVARAIPEAEAEEARRRVNQAAKKNHHTADERSLFTAGFFLLLTNLPSDLYSLQCVLALYRFRWQVELAFKRLKSLIHLDHLRAKDPELAQVYLLAKLLAVIFMERIQLFLMAQYPQDFYSQKRPISLWRLNKLLWDQLCSLIRGPISLELILTVFPLLLRYIRDDPCSRVQQLAVARNLFGGLYGC